MEMAFAFATIAPSGSQYYSVATIVVSYLHKWYHAVLMLVVLVTVVVIPSS